MSAKGQKAARCSILIRSFNEEKHLGRLLKAIEGQSLKDVEIILVDSGSTDATLAIAARHLVRVLHIQPEEFTFGRSLNIGMRAAKAEYVVLASAHVYPLQTDWLEKLLAPLDDPEVALSYGKQRGGEGSKFSEDRHFKRWFPEKSDLEQAHAFCNNANAALKRSLWEQNPFDESLTGLEDIAWASWAKEQGYRIAYVAEAGVAHLHDESARQIVNRHRREAMALKRILPKSRFSLWHFASLTLRRVLSDLGAAAREGRLLGEAWDILRFRFLQYWGTYRGYHERGELTLELKQVFYYPPGLLETRSTREGRKAEETTHPEKVRKAG